MTTVKNESPKMDAQIAKIVEDFAFLFGSVLPKSVKEESKSRKRRSKKTRVAL